MAHLTGRERTRYVTRMFGRIARRYDLLNGVMSGGRHHAWRRIAVEMGTPDLVGPALDVAAGTGDFALELLRTGWTTDVVAFDNTLDMLAVAVEKARRRGLGHRLRTVTGDAHSLPFADDSFVCVTVGFGVRNFVDVPRALGEMVRVVRPGGTVVVLDIFRLEGRTLLDRLFPVYFRTVIAVARGTAGGGPRGLRLSPEVGRDLPERRRAGHDDGGGGTDRGALPASRAGQRRHTRGLQTFFSRLAGAKVVTIAR